MTGSKIVGVITIILGTLLLAAISTSPKAYAWDTHMTFHNLLTAEPNEFPAELSIVGASSCVAQAGSTCEAGADYVWYNAKVCVGYCSVNPVWRTPLLGVYGHCDVYIQFVNNAENQPVFDATHHCTAAEKAGLEPPSTIPVPKSVPHDQNSTR